MKTRRGLQRQQFMPAKLCVLLAGAESDSAQCQPAWSLTLRSVSLSGALANKDFCLFKKKSTCGASHSEIFIFKKSLTPRSVSLHGDIYFANISVKMNFFLVKPVNQRPRQARIMKKNSKKSCDTASLNNFFEKTNCGVLRRNLDNFQTSSNQFR